MFAFRLAQPLAIKPKRPIWPKPQNWPKTNEKDQIGAKKSPKGPRMTKNGPKWSKDKNGQQYKKLQKGSNRQNKRPKLARKAKK